MPSINPGEHFGSSEAKQESPGRCVCPANQPRHTTDAVLSPPSETDTNSHPSPAGRPPHSPTASARSPALCGDKAPGAAGTRTQDGGSRERAASSTGAPQSSQNGLGTYRDSRPPRPATAAALSGASAPSPAPCPGAARAALWDKRLVRAVQRSPDASGPRPRPPPAPPFPGPAHPA